MSLLDFLTKPRTSWQSGGSTSLSFPQVQSQDSMGYTDAPLEIGTSAPVQAMSAPQQVDKPSLLSEAWNWLKSPDGLMTVATGLRSASGDQDATGPALAYAEQQNKLALQRQALQQKRDAIKAKNAAYRAGYASGKWDPKAYADYLAKADANGDIDLAEGLSDAAPKTGISDGVSYQQNPITGAIEWGDARPMTGPEQAKIEDAQRNYALAVQRYNEAVRHNRAGEATAASNAARAWAAHYARLKAGGYGTPGVGTAGQIPDDDVSVDP